MKIRNLIKTMLASAVLVVASQAHAGLIVTSADSNIANNATFFSNAFGGQDVFGRTGINKPWASQNWSNSVITASNSYSSGAALTAGDIIGMEWIIAGSASLWTAGELNVLNGFVSNGGNVWVVGEYGPLHNDISISGNSVLSALGSSMSFALDENNFADGNQIAVHALTAGVISWNGGSAGRVIDGTALVTNPDGVVLVAYEDAGVIVVDVPAPATIFLMVLGLVGFGLSSRKKLR